MRGWRDGVRLQLSESQHNIDNVKCILVQKLHFVVLIRSWEEGSVIESPSFAFAWECSGLQSIKKHEFDNAWRIVTGLLQRSDQIMNDLITATCSTSQMCLFSPSVVHFEMAECHLLNGRGAFACYGLISFLLHVFHSLIYQRHFLFRWQCSNIPFIHPPTFLLLSFRILLTYIRCWNFDDVSLPLNHPTVGSVLSVFSCTRVTFQSGWWPAISTTTASACLNLPSPFTSAFWQCERNIVQAYTEIAQSGVFFFACCVSCDPIFIH